MAPRWWRLLISGLTLVAEAQLSQDAAHPNVLQLSTKQFKQYGTRRRDDFALAVLVSAETPRCEYCRYASQIFFEGVSKIKAKANDAVIRDSQGRAIVFGELDVLANMDAGQVLGLQDVPHLYVIHSRDLDCRQQPCSLKVRDLLVKSQNLSSKVFFEPILAELGREDLMVKHFIPRQWITRKRLLAGFVTLTIITLPLLPRLSRLLNKHMWIVGAFATACYTLSTSGIIYNWQNDSWDLFGTDPSGARRYVHPSSRSQYLGEGLMLAIANVLLSATFLGVLGLLKRPKRAKLAAAAAALLCVFIVVLYVQISAQVHRKIPYLSYPLFPPDSSYVRGGPRRDKGYTT